MMADRPLTGSFEQLASGAWKASVPECRGSRRRVAATFATRPEVEAWVTTAMAALRNGRAVAGPDSSTPDGTHWLASAADKWFDSKYQRAQLAGPGRGDAVRHPWTSLCCGSSSSAGRRRTMSRLKIVWSSCCTSLGAAGPTAHLSSALTRACRQ